MKFLDKFVFKKQLKNRILKIMVRLIAIANLFHLVIFTAYGDIWSQENKAAASPKDKRPHWVDFYREQITINCYENEIVVIGVYYLRNLRDNKITMTIKYPFPIDKFHPFPKNIAVENYPFWKDSSNIYLKMSLNPKEEKSITFHYSQEHYNESATYILSSTQHWGHSIKKADFIISLPLKWTNVSISLKPDRTETQKKRKIYYITKFDFYPAKDLVTTWN